MDCGFVQWAFSKSLSFFILLSEMYFHTKNKNDRRKPEGMLQLGFGGSFGLFSFMVLCFPDFFPNIVAI